MQNDLKDLSKIKQNLSPEAQRNIEKTDSFNKSNAINTIYKIQEEHIQKARESGDRQKVREAHEFARRLETEIRFLRNK